MGKSYAASDAGTLCSCSINGHLMDFPMACCVGEVHDRFLLLPYCGVCATTPPIYLLPRGMSVIAVITPTSMQHRPLQQIPVQ